MIQRFDHKQNDADEQRKKREFSSETSSWTSSDNNGRTYFEKRVSRDERRMCETRERKDEGNDGL